MTNTNTYWYEGTRPVYGYLDSEDLYAKITGHDEGAKYFLKPAGGSERSVPRANKLLDEVLLQGAPTSEDKYNAA